MENAFDDLLFDVRRSVRYHNRRRSFYDRFHKSNTVLGLIGGSAVVATLLADRGPDFLPLVFGAVVAISSALDLVIGSAGQARRHHDFARRYFNLEKEMVAAEPRNDRKKISAWTQARLEIEAEEPPVMHVLNVICHNELCRALGYNENQMVKIGPVQRLLSNVVDVGEYKIKAGQAC